MDTIEIRASLEKRNAVLEAHPEKAHIRGGPETATLEGGLRCRVDGPNDQRIYTDMPPALGGGGSAPNPGWYLRAAIASCTATVIAMRAAHLGITLTTLSVSVEADTDQRGLLGTDQRISAGVSTLRTRVRIGAGGTDPDTLRELVVWGDAHSPVACTVRNAPACSVDVEIVSGGSETTS